MRCIREQRFFLLYFLAEERDGFPAKSERMFLTQKRCLSEPFFVFTLNGCQKESAAAAAAAAAALYAKQAVRRRIEERRREGRDRPQFSQGKAEKPEKKGDMSFVPLLSFFFLLGTRSKERREVLNLAHAHTCIYPFSILPSFSSAVRACVCFYLRRHQTSPR